MQSCRHCLLEPCPFWEHSWVHQEPWQNLPPGMLMGRVNMHGPAGHSWGSPWQVPPGLNEKPEVIPKTEPDISSPPGISATIPGEYTQIKRRNFCMDGSFQGKLCNPLVCRFLQIRRPTHSENHGSQKVLAWVNRRHLAQSPTKTHD